MSKAKDVLKLIKDEEIEWVDLRFTDPKGKWQHLTMVASVMGEDELEDGLMFDGSSIEGWKAINESDMILMPDPSTAIIDPFFEETTLDLRCDIVEPSTMQGYERDTWYDINGRIVFTNSKGLVGVGLPRKGGKKTPRTFIQTPDGKITNGNFGWEDLWTYPSEDCTDETLVSTGGSPKVLDGTVITQLVTDDTLPGGPREVVKTYVAPFSRSSREDDYRVAWDFFSSRENA